MRGEQSQGWAVFEAGGAASLQKGWRCHAGSWVALGLEQELGNLAPCPSGPRSRVWLLPELGWAATALRSGHGTGKRGLWGCHQPSASLRDTREDTGRAWQRNLNLSFLPPLCDWLVLPRQCWAGGRQPPEVPTAPQGTQRPQQHLGSAPDASRAQQRDAKSHHTNYANRINYSCYSEGSPESSLAL